VDVCCGSWLCENTKTLERDRKSYSSETVLTLKLASAFNLDDELKNVILVVFQSFAFLHSEVIFDRVCGLCQPLDVRLTPKAKQLLHSREMTRRANKRLSWRGPFGDRIAAVLMEDQSGSMTVPLTNRSRIT
jgi:hypothetical protein